MLAPTAAAEAPEVQELDSSSCKGGSGSEEAKEFEICATAFEVASQFQRSRTPTICSKGGKDDLVLPELPEAKFGKVRYVPDMWPTLDCSLDGAKEQEKDEESKPTSAKDEGTKGDQGRSRGFRCISRSSSMDGINTPFSGPSNSKRGSQQGVAGVGHAACSNPTSASSATCINFRRSSVLVARRVEDLGTSSRNREDELGALGPTERSSQDLGVQGEVFSIGQAPDSCTSQQARQDQEASCIKCKEDSGGGSGMEKLHDKSLQQGSAACRPLSIMPSKSDSGLQFESGRTTQAQQGAVASIPNNAGTELGCRRNHGGHGNRCRSAQISDSDQYDSGPHQSGRGYGRCPSRRQWGRECGVGQGQPGETQTKADLQCIGVASSCCKSDLEGQKRDQSIVDAGRCDCRRFASEFLNDAEKDLNRLFACAFPWSIFEGNAMTSIGSRVVADDRSSQLKIKHVRFNTDVQVRLCCEDESEEPLDIVVPLQTAYFRTMWDLECQHMSWKACQAVCTKFHEGLNFSQVSTDTFDVAGDDHAETQEDGESHIQDVENADVASRHEHLGSLRTGNDSQERCLFVDTWFVRPPAIPVCTVPRRVRLQPDDNEDRIREKILSRWEDFRDESACRFHEVVGSSEARCRRIIVTQHVSDFERVALLCYDGFPPLQKTRAIHFQAESTALQIIRVAGMPRICDSIQIKCLLEFEVNGQSQSFETHEVVVVDDPVVFQAQVMLLDDQDSQSEQDEIDDVSTQTPSEDELSVEWSMPDDDVVSLAGFRPSWVDFQPIIPNPAQMWHDFVGDTMALDDDVEEEVNEDIHVLTHQWNEVLGAFHSAVTTAREGFFLIVTFGLGLIDLGRRDGWCRERELDRILEHIRHMWSDHAQFAELQVILVKPQPDLQIVHPHVIVIVEVLYVAVDHPNRGVPVLVHETGDTAAERATYAARVGRSESATTMLHSLQREQGIHPYGVRDAIISCGDRILPMYDFVEIEEGSFCKLWISSYPLHVTAAAEHVSNAESLLTDVRTFVENNDEPSIECVFHGVSPQNRPLGDRSIWLPPHAFYAGTWYEQAKAVWPFPSRLARLLYIKRTIEGKGVEDRHQVLHFIVSYQEDLAEVPVLIRQSIYAVESGTSHSEVWAVRIPAGLAASQVVTHLRSPIFWTQYPERLKVSSNCDPSQVHAGDALDLAMQTHRTTNILDFSDFGCHAG